MLWTRAALSYWRTHACGFDLCRLADSPVPAACSDGTNSGRTNSMIILVLNAGSSSEKASLFNLTDASFTDPQDPLWDAEIEWSVPGAEAKLTVRTANGSH